MGTEVGIPADALATFDRLYGVEIEKLDANLARTISQKTGELASRGGLNSGGAVRAIFDLIEATVPIRAHLGVTLLCRCLAAHRISINDDTKQATKDILSKRMEDARSSLMSLAESQPTLKQSAMQQAIRVTLETFTRVVDREIIRVTSEVDLMAASAAVAAETAGGPSPGMVFHGPVGVVQTGPGSFGVAVQHIDQTATQAIRKALDEITVALSSGNDDPSFDVQDVTEMVEQSRAELDKAKPNAPKLVAMLQGIGSVISYAPKLRAAYETLRWALAFVGVTLP